MPFISSSQLKANYSNFTILDSREYEEYEISHLNNAICIGYDNFNFNKTKKQLSLKKPIVVYCSIGYRSEKIGEKLLKKGFTVYNLYGGIFEWKNKNNPVFDNSKQTTNKIHCFDVSWGKWLVNGEKIYSKQI